MLTFSTFPKHSHLGISTSFRLLESSMSLCYKYIFLSFLSLMPGSLLQHSIINHLSSIQELQKGMDAHKAEVLSINLSSADFLQSEPDSEEAWELRDRLKEMNSRWDRLGASLEDWREELQRALMQCQVLKAHTNFGSPLLSSTNLQQ